MYWNANNNLKMKKAIFNIMFFGLLTFLLACEGIVGGDGHIYDSKTKLPLKGVKVVLLLDDNIADSCYSDEQGFFRGSLFVGCVPNCPDAKIVLTKDGFDVLTIDFDEYWEKHNHNPVSKDSLILHLTPNK